jgi:hypothetical protein
MARADEGSIKIHGQNSNILLKEEGRIMNYEGKQRRK